MNCTLAAKKKKESSDKKTFSKEERTKSVIIKTIKNSCPRESIIIVALIKRELKKEKRSDSEKFGEDWCDQKSMNSILEAKNKSQKLVKKII